MANTSTDYKTGWLHDTELLERPQGQKVFMCTHDVLIRRQLIITPGVKLAFRE